MQSTRADTSATPDAHGGTSGDVTQPQPISRADANTGGANGQCPGGPYCSTRDGSASGNGNGGGQAVGKPCAGCVGKADNKNPRGQRPGGADANAGHECDTNHGIARTNPAHTGCRTAPAQECVPTPTVPCVPSEACVPTPTVPCVPSGGDVEGSVLVSAPVSGPVFAAPPASAASRPVPAGLPETGAPADLVGLTLAGLAAVLGGAAVLARRTRLGSRSTG